MNILVDTHIFIWMLDEQYELSATRRRHIEDAQNRVCLSQISLMELAIKKQLNKLPRFIQTIDTLAKAWLERGFEILPLSNDHIFTYQQVPLHDEHRDLFDRFILAAALHEQMAVMTDDQKFGLYASLVQLI